MYQRKTLDLTPWIKTEPKRPINIQQNTERGYKNRMKIRNLRKEMKIKLHQLNA